MPGQPSAEATAGKVREHPSLASRKEGWSGNSEGSEAETPGSRPK
jgi:hypothetical protein